MRPPVRTIQPTLEPVTLEQAQLQCRVTDDNSDALLTMLIQAAREYAEVRMGRAILQQTWRLSMSFFPGWRGHRAGHRRHWPYLNSSGFWPMPSPILLPWPNLIGIVGVTYLDPTGTQQTLDPSLYLVDSDAAPAAILPTPGTWWPATLWGTDNAVQVTYTAGYGNSQAAVPMRVQLAILGLVAHWYENREAVVLTERPNAVTIVPHFIDSLLDSEAVIAFTYED